MTWILGLIISIMGGLIFFLSRKQGQDAAKISNLEETLVKTVESEKQSATIDVEVATNRSNLRHWLRDEDDPN